jgi:putative ABC transport system substrate-binding protein
MKEVRNQRSEVSKSLALGACLLGVSVLCALLLALSFPAEAQQPKVYRIGFLGNFASPFTEAFQQGLRDLGYVESHNIKIEYRWAAGKIDHLPKLAAELAGLNPDVLVTAGTQPTLAAKQATSTIPIVIAISSDPVGTGLVASLARPSGNVTGLSHLNVEVSGKRLEILKEAFPKISTVGVLWNADHPAKVLEWKVAEAAAPALRTTLRSFEVRSPADFDRAFSAATKEPVDALLTFEDPLTLAHRQKIVEFAAKRRLPAMYEPKEFADAGGLMCYGPSFPDLYRRAAAYVDKILKGTKPGELPVEQPTKFEFIINLKAAKQIGVTIPPNVLARADKVIK